MGKSVQTVCIKLKSCLFRLAFGVPIGKGVCRNDSAGRYQTTKSLLRLELSYRPSHLYGILPNADR